jgi:OOP family OmpA-OmpF porin
MLRSPLIPPVTGTAIVVFLALIASQSSQGALTQQLAEGATAAIAEAGGTGIEAEFVSPWGNPGRHPVITGGENLDESVRDRVAKAVAAVPGVGGVRWADGTGLASGNVVELRPLHCQEDVQALLRARSIRFEEGSARIDAASLELVDEVADALRPCLGSIIAIIGHTDNSGTVAGNLALSQERADAVRRSLIRRGIPSDGLRTQGLGSSEPVAGLDPSDPANRRIDFSVIETVAIMPTAVDTPGPR